MQHHWWESAITYQIYVRSFGDADGDGIGDLEGIRRRLPHVAALGADAIWLTPCYPSPQHDHGYDVADYFSIDPAYGDLAAFDALVDGARQLGLRVVMDVVPNHCSIEHPWFVAALAAGPGSPERARFYFRDGRGANGDEPPNNWRSTFAGSSWTRITEPDGRPGQWYLHSFTPEQPDFDWSHPDVVEHFDRMLRFWFDRGVDGFRVDAVTVIGKAPGLPDAPPPSSPRIHDVGRSNPYTTFRPEGHEVWRRWRRVFDEYQREHPDRDLVMIAEAYTGRQPEKLAEYVRPDEFHQSFAFDLLLTPWIATAMRSVVTSTLGVVAPSGGRPAWALNNHDVQRAVTRYGRADSTTDAHWNDNNLVYSRAPVDVVRGTRRARAAIMLVLALPGATYLYQGEELGLPEVLDLPDEARQDPVWFRTRGAELGRDGCRVPLPWTADPATSFGFSDGDDPAPPWLPQPAWWGDDAASAQQGVATSVLELYRRVLAVRREYRELRSGDLVWQEHPSPDVLAFARGDVLVVLNAGGEPVRLDAGLLRGRAVVASSLHGHADPAVVPADTALWLA